MNRPDDKARVALEEIDLEALALGANYAEADAVEDGLIETLLGWLRQPAVLGASPAHVRQLDRWESAWRPADAKADRQVATGALGIHELVSVGERYAVAVAG